MNVASKDLCRELYELSGWELDSLPNIQHDNGAPAYDLGYLLRKLPKCTKYGWLQLAPITADKWSAYYQDDAFHNNPDEWADTPEDATCKLVIELFKQGVLTK